MVEDRYAQAGEKSEAEEAEQEGQKETETQSPPVPLQGELLPGGDKSCLDIQPWSLHLPARAMAAASSGCDCFGRLNTECSLGTDTASRRGSFNESCQ